jgi:hypothetical protein
MRQSSRSEWQWIWGLLPQGLSLGFSFVSASFSQLGAISWKWTVHVSRKFLCCQKTSKDLQQGLPMSCSSGATGLKHMNYTRVRQKCSFNGAHIPNIFFVLNELCFWTLPIVWCFENKQNWGIKNYRQKITIHTSTNKSHKGQGFMCVCVCVRARARPGKLLCG